MSKKILFSLLGLIIVLVFLTGIWLGIRYVQKNNPSLIEFKLPKIWREGRKAGIYKIISPKKTYPRFFGKFIVKPYEVLTGDHQNFYIWIEDPSGIKKVSGEIQTDFKTPHLVNFTLIKGNNKKGEYMGKWHCCRISKKDYYNIKITAESVSGQKNVFIGSFKKLKYEDQK